MSAIPEHPTEPRRPVPVPPALAERAVALLSTPLTRLPLTAEEAAHVVARMGAVSFPAGSHVLREGEGQRADYLLLLIEGEVQVDTRAGMERAPLEISVLGPGSIIGEMSLIDGEPRSASCTALGRVVAVGLSRRGLEALLDEEPRVAAKLLLGLAQRLADRLRALGQQIHMVAELATAPPTQT